MMFRETRELARMIDHTLLRADATREQIEQLCREAIEYGFACVCVNTCNVEFCGELLAGSGVKVCGVVGFPLGAMASSAKAFEAAEAARLGAEEIDMVINIGKLKSGDYEGVRADIGAVVSAAKGRPVKAIIETGMLSDSEKVSACQIAKEAGARFVKTSTGFGPGGATAENVALMRHAAGPELGVKASGGIRDLAAALRMLHCGATRIGTSSGVAIIREARQRELAE